MAVTKIHAIKKTLNKALAYILDEAKTDGDLLSSGFVVLPDAKTATSQMRMTQLLAESIKGDYSAVGGGNNLAYHMIQSFDKSDKLTPQQAHEIGKEWAKGVLNDQYEYVIATHIDKEHIHNHVIFNATSFETYTKYKSIPYKTVKQLRRINDEICKIHGLNVCIPKGKGKKRGEIETRKRKVSWKAQIEEIIDNAMLHATDYEDLLRRIRLADVEIKNGKYIAFKLKGQERFVRGKTLGEPYTRYGLQTRAMRGAKKAHGKESNEVTINKGLVTEKRGGYFTKIPYQPIYLQYSTAQSKWVSEITLKVKLNSNQSYTIFDKEGNKIDIKTGKEILNYYQKAEIRFNLHKENGDKLLSEQLDEVYRQVTGHRKYSKDEWMKKINRLCTAMYIASSEDVHIHKTFIERLLELEQESFELKHTIDTIKIKHSEYKDIAKCLITHKANAQIAEQINQGKGIKRKRLVNKHSDDVIAFDEANALLERLGVDPRVDVNVVYQQLQEQMKEINRIQYKYKNIEERIEKLRYAQKVIQHEESMDINNEMDKRQGQTKSNIKQKTKISSRQER